MSKESIIETLTSQQLLTTENIQTLKNQTTDKDFLQSLIAIYETSMFNYFSTSARRLKRFLSKKGIYSPESIDDITTQKIIEYGYSSLLNRDKTAFLVSLTLLLKKYFPELAVSLGMISTYKDPTTNKIYSFNDLSKSIFLSYMARHCLFLDLNTDDLKSLCEAVKTDMPDLFPLYLLNALSVQKEINLTIKTAMTSTEKNTLSWPILLAQALEENEEIVKTALIGLIFFIENKLNSLDLHSEMRDLFFSHLEKRDDRLAFAASLSSGYLEKMSVSDEQNNITKDNNAILESDIQSICMPNLILMGFPLTVDVDAIAEQHKNTLQAHKNQQTLLETQLSTLQANITTIQAQQVTLTQNANKLREEAHVVAESIKNQPRQWTIGFGPAMGTPGASCHF